MEFNKKLCNMKIYKVHFYKTVVFGVCYIFRKSQNSEFSNNRVTHRDLPPIIAAKQIELGNLQGELSDNGYHLKRYIFFNSFCLIT